MNVEGYLTQYSVRREEETLNRVEIAAKQIRLLQPHFETNTEMQKNGQVLAEIERGEGDTHDLSHQDK